jgi:hypothetical protein
MLELTAEYALRAAADLANAAPRRRTTREIAAATGVPAGYLTVVLRQRKSALPQARRRGRGPLPRSPRLQRCER